MKKFRPRLFEFFRAFLYSDICTFWDLFVAQITFSEMFLIAFDKILSTFESFFDYFEPFSQTEAVVFVCETTCSFSVSLNTARSSLSSGKIKARKFKKFRPKYSLISVLAGTVLKIEFRTITNKNVAAWNIAVHTSYFGLFSQISWEGFYGQLWPQMDFPWKFSSSPFDKIWSGDST